MDQNAALFQFRISIGRNSRNLFEFGRGVKGLSASTEILEFNAVKKFQWGRIVAGAI
jgi:hypothetical protein